ncbi:hypothetical protein [Frondihabitans sp. PAMC 28766]|uniref:hypothetical protein n=1 Tax=Frondihabitans sp. PAMC 28766 TaxID=1795630 RepID=UPI00194F19CB|nr:hypothetical protein [Frondihabitans sp. PAMC 28766]
MVPLLIIVLIVGIILFGISFIGAALHFLLWIGLIIVVIAIIGWIVRAVRSRV